MRGIPLSLIFSTIFSASTNKGAEEIEGEEETKRGEEGEEKEEEEEEEEEEEKDKGEAVLTTIFL